MRCREIFRHDGKWNEQYSQGVCREVYQLTQPQFLRECEYICLFECVYYVGAELGGSSDNLRQLPIQLLEIERTVRT